MTKKNVKKKKRSVKYSESPKKHYCPQVGVRPKYRKKSSFLVIYLHYGTEAVRNGQDTNNAIRPLLEEHAKTCYLTWQYIDMKSADEMMMMMMMMMSDDVFENAM